MKGHPELSEALHVFLDVDLPITRGSVQNLLDLDVHLVHLEVGLRELVQRPLGRNMQRSEKSDWFDHQIEQISVRTALTQWACPH